MEDPNEEWEIQEHGLISESNYGGKVSWILNKGVGLGKKVLVAGFLISSAPLVLPGLLIVSAIGFAVSIPSGIILASYACAEKLMSKLLPRPAPLLLKGHRKVTDSEEETTRENVDYMRKKEEDTSDKESSELKEAGKAIEGGGYGHGGPKRQAPVEDSGDVDIAVEENGYEEVGEYQDVEEENPLEQINVVQIEGDGEEYKEENLLLDESSNQESIEMQGVVLDLVVGGEEKGDATIEVTSVVMRENEGQASVNDIEEDEIAKETRGLLETIRDEGKAENPPEKETVGGEENGDQKIFTKDRETPVECKTADNDVELGRTVERDSKEEPKHGQGTQGKKHMKEVNDVQLDVNVINEEKANISENKTIDVEIVAEKPIVETSNSASVRDVGGHEKTPALNGISTEQGEKAGDNIATASPLIRENKVVVLPNADAREVGAVCETPHGKSSYDYASSFPRSVYSVCGMRYSFFLMLLFW